MNFETILLNGKRAFADTARREGCLPTDLLIDYGYDDLEKATRDAAAAHISECDACRIALFKIEADRLEWEKGLDIAPDETLARVLGEAGKTSIDSWIDRITGREMDPGLHPTTPNRFAMSKLKEALIEWVSPLWEPMWAGQVVTAADIPEQSHRFEMGDGEYIHISCIWRSRTFEVVTHLQVTWEANLYSPSNIWVQWVDPETHEILCEACLGNELTGKLLLDRDRLGFDPSTRRFAVGVWIEAQ